MRSSLLNSYWQVKKRRKNICLAMNNWLVIIGVSNMDTCGWTEKSALNLVSLSSVGGSHCIFASSLTHPLLFPSPVQTFPISLSRHILFFLRPYFLLYLLYSTPRQLFLHTMGCTISSNYGGDDEARARTSNGGHWKSTLNLFYR